jgi:glycine/D-amino acid oxidase-like deaminating enzyme
MIPHLGYVGDERVLISTGCSGHGAVTALQHGRTLTDLVFEKDTELSRFWMVRRKPVKWPPNPLGELALRSVLGLMKIEDRLKLRHLK